MPNWVYNTIAVKGNKNDVISFIKKMNDKVTENDSIDTIIDALVQGNKGDNAPSFNTFIPMPQTYVDYDTTNYPNGERIYFNVEKECDFIANLKLFEGVETNPIYTYLKDVNNHFVSTLDTKDKVLAEFISKTTKEVYRLSTLDRAEIESVVADFLNKLYDKVVEYKEATTYQEKTYGYIGWYQWCLNNYGTKWNAFFDDYDLRELDNDEYLLCFRCETAWGVPDTFLITTRNMFPTLRFAVRTYEESLAFNGFFNVDEDDWVENNVPSYDAEYEDMWDNELWDGIEERFDDYITKTL